MKLHVNEKDLLNIEKKMNELSGVSVSVGVAKGEREKVAIKMEFGTNKIPARPFMQPVLREKRYVIPALRMAFKSWRAKKGDIADFFMLRLVGDVQSYITKLSPGTTWRGITAPKLAPSTIKAKGHDKLLVHTTTLFRSITGKVTRNRGRR